MLDGSSPDQVVVKDRLRVLGLDVAVPDILRINHYHGPMAALIHAPGLVDADGYIEACSVHKILETGMNADRLPLYRADGAAGADKDVFFELTHGFELSDLTAEIIARGPDCTL